MYTASVPHPTFYHHQPTRHYPAAAYGQPRVGKYGGDRPIMSPYQDGYSYRTPGIILGSLILLLSLALLSVELGRLYAGSNNRGQTVANDTTYNYLMYPDNIIGYNGFTSNPKVENRWMWPWSTATLLFSLLFISTGVLGIICSRRESYSSILTFFICSLVSLCLLAFIIASYSTTITGWRSIYGSGNGAVMGRYARIDRDLSIVCLSISCVLFLLLLLALSSAGRAIDVCTRKRFLHGENDPERLLAPGTPQTPRFGY